MPREWKNDEPSAIISIIDLFWCRTEVTIETNCPFIDTRFLATNLQTNIEPTLLKVRTNAPLLISLNVMIHSQYWTNEEFFYYFPFKHSQFCICVLFLCLACISVSTGSEETPGNSANISPQIQSMMDETHNHFKY